MQQHPFSVFNPGSLFHAVQAGASRLPVLLGKCLVPCLTANVPLIPAECRLVPLKIYFWLIGKRRDQYVTTTRVAGGCRFCPCRAHPRLNKPQYLEEAWGRGALAIQSWLREEMRWLAFQTKSQIPTVSLLPCLHFLLSSGPVPRPFLGSR